MTTSVRALIVLLLGASLVSGCGGGDSVRMPAATPTTQPAEPLGDALTPLVGSVPFAPVPFAGSDGKTHLVYELSVVNFTSAPVRFDGLQVLDAATGATVGQLDAAALKSRLAPAGERSGAEELGAGQAGMVFLHLVFDDPDAVPDKIVHQADIQASALPAGSDVLTERLAPVDVDRRTLPVISAPLAGERYIAADGCCDAVRHTRAVLPVNGQAFLAQRYAIDYEQADEQNRIYTGDPKNPASYRIFGRQALAVADGTVVGTRNDLPEQTPGTYPAGIPIDEADGNFVVLDIGDGFYVNYAHLQPGSVRPKLGDTVKRGEVIGLVGNTGNSVAPHLHLHVMDGPSPLASQGLPYLYDRFTLTGQVASTADFDTSEATGAPLVLVPGVSPTEHTGEMVLDQNLVTFTP